MVRKIIFISTLLLTSTFLFSQSEKYEGHFIDAPINEVIELLEEKYGLLFSYKKEDLNGVFISENISENELPVFLNHIFQDNGFETEIVDRKYILLKKKSISGNIGEIKEPLFSFCGTILEAGSKEPLIAVNIYIEGTKHGTISQLDGSFEMKAPMKKNDTLSISYVGYKTIAIPAHELADKGCRDFFLSFSQNIIGCGRIIITEYLTDGIELTNNGSANVLNLNKIGALPGQAEPDVFTTINFLPGISSSSGEPSKLNIRGGAGDQNLILWEGIPIYQPAHYFGMISAFNPYIIDEIKIYRGGFGPEYGGRISGIIDMSSDDAVNPEPNFGAGSNFLNGYVYGKTPLIKNKASLVFSARRSMTEIWRSPTFNNITRRNQQGQLFENLDVYNLPPHISISDDFYFFNTHLKTNIQVSQKDKLSAAYFYGKNNFDDLIIDHKMNDEKSDDLNIENSGGSISWAHNWKKNISTKASYVTTDYDSRYDFSIDFFDGNRRGFKVTKNNRVNEKQINIVNKFTNRNEHQFSIGYQNLNFKVDYLIKRTEDESVRIDQEDSFNSNINVLYADIKTNPDLKYGMDMGFRWNHYDINNKNYFEPRLRLWYKLPMGFTFSANAGKYNQFISQLIEIRGNNEGIEIPTWVMTGEKGKDEPVVLNGTQYQAGAIFRKNTWLIDVQAYVKKTKGMSSLATGFDPTPRQELGRANTQGIDMLLKKRWGKYRSWISYSLSKTTYKFRQFFDREFPAPFDQRHVFNWVNLYEHGNFEFSLGLEFTSGNPYSFMKNFERIKDDMGKDIYRYIYDELNDRNLSFQHRADASIRYKFENKKKGKLKGTVGFSVFNIYAKKNFYARDYYVRNRPNMPETIEFVNKAHMGFTPNAAFRLEW